MASKTLRKRAVEMAPPYSLFYVCFPGDQVVDLDEEFQDLRDARREAVLIAREVIADRLRAGRAAEFGCIQIRDAQGAVVAQISTYDALRPDP
jgi:hypothetical protein